MTKKLFILAAMSFSLFFAFDADAQITNSSTTPGVTTFLRLKMDAVGSAVGGAMTATASGSQGIQWNPAGLINPSGSSVEFTHQKSFEDISTEFVSYSFSRGEKNSLALSLFANNIDGIEKRSIASEIPEAIISSHDIYFGLTYARKQSDKLNLGITGKFLYQKYFEYSAKGYSFDLGATYSLNDKTSLGAVLLNVGSLGALISEKADMPTSIKVGASHKFEIPGRSESLVVLSADAESVANANSHMHVGAEYTAHGKYSLRAGYVTGYEERALSYGCGLIYKTYRFNYAFIPDITPFGSNHQFSFAIDLN